MKLYEAKKLIQSVFEQTFNKDRFDLFIRNLLLDFEVKPTTYTGNIIPNAFDKYIRKMERLGKFEDEDGHVLDILMVELKREHSLEYARSAQRNFIRWYLAGSRGGQMKDAALVAFYTEESAEWRFSLIKMQYSLETKKDEITPAKRSSFLVGEKGKSHTAQQQLVKLLKSDDIPLLSDLEEAFNVETVSNEFFEKYKMLALNLTDELDKIIEQDATVKREFETKQIATIDFSKKLLGQIVFLYFLQRKGWLGLKHGEQYGEGNRNFLRSLYQMKQSGENFYNDYLEFLFYEALSKKRVTDEYSRFNCRIPFLNGGLFDPIQFYDWEYTDIVIPDVLFTNDNKTKEGDIGDGILDIFDRYNFTVNESEPLEKEVAVDPEMLGKVFERMLEVKERKSKGAFYTPREIVHYMSQESLIHYLDSALNKVPQSYESIGKDQGQMFGNEVAHGQNELLIDHSEDVKVPKEDIEVLIKHGEYFLENEEQVLRQGEETRTYKHKIPESIRAHATLIDEKLRDIRVCDPAVGSGAFPVGVMTEIVKSRSILYKLQHPIKQPSHYEFKNHAIHHCLYGVDIDPSAVEICKLRLWLSLVVDEQRIDRIEPLPNLDYKIVRGNSLINMPDDVMRDQQLEKEIEQLMEQYYAETDKQAKRDLKDVIDGKIKQLLQSAEQFTNYPIDFDFKLFFHEVFKEKKGFDVVIANPPYVDIKNLPNRFVRQLFTLFQTAQNRINLYALFIEKSTYLLNYTGCLTFINPNSLLVNTSYTKIRNLLVDKVVTLIKLPNRVFEHAIVETMILIAINHTKDNNVNGAFYKNDALINMNNIIFNKFDRRTWYIDKHKRFSIFNSPDICMLLKKIKNSYPFTCNFYDFSLGITPYDKYKGHTKELIKGKRYHSPDKKDETYVPLILGENINRFYIDSEIKGYLKYGPWLGAPRQKKFFTEPRVIVRQIISGVPGRIFAGYTEKKLFHTQVGFSILPNSKNLFSPKYLCALLNSSVINFYHKYKFLDIEKTTFQKILIQNCKQFPFKIISKELEKSFNLIIDYLNIIIADKNEKSSVSSSFFDQLLDAMVFELYFENEIKKAGRDVLKHLTNLTPITDDMTDNEKMEIITRTFNELYDKNHPVRQNLYYMDTIEEVRIVKGLDS